MALTRPLLTRLRALAGVLETTNGTAASYSVSDAATRIYDPKFSGNINWIPRERAGFGQSKSGTGARGCTVTFAHELYGNGATGVGQQLRFLQACGLALSGGTLTADATSAQTITLVGYQDGRIRVAPGCMGNAVITAVSGQAAVVAYTFTGKYAVPSAGALISPTRDTTVAPRCAAAVITVGGSSYKFPSYELDFGNEVVLREDADDTGGTGYVSAMIVNRSARLKLSPEGSTGKFWDVDFLASTETAFSSAIGSDANNTITTTASKLQLAQPAEDEDANGIYREGLTFALNDDNLVIAYS
jgi:hypothetical protein